MTPFAEAIFLTEIVNQIKGARRALDRLKLAAKEGNSEAVYDEASDLVVVKIIRRSPAEMTNLQGE